MGWTKNLSNSYISLSVLLGTVFQMVRVLWTSSIAFIWSKAKAPWSFEKVSISNSLGNSVKKIQACRLPIIKYNNYINGHPLQMYLILSNDFITTRNKMISISHGVHMSDLMVWKINKNWAAKSKLASMKIKMFSITLKQRALDIFKSWSET